MMDPLQKALEPKADEPDGDTMAEVLRAFARVEEAERNMAAVMALIERLEAEAPDPSLSQAPRPVKGEGDA